MKRWISQQRLAAVGSVLAVTMLLAACGSSSSSSSSGTASNTTKHTSNAVLTMESSQQNSITKDFNPFVQSSAATLLGATTLIYEPLLQFNAIKPGSVYNWLATGYTWSNGGKTITFTIRPGVKWSNGTPFTSADVAFNYNLMKQYADVNIWGIPVTSASASGNKAIVNFSTPQYANLQNIAGQTYMVPKSIWASIGDPGKHVDATPVGTGPYMLDLFSSQGFTLKANPNYWGGAVPVGKVQFPAYASASSALSALQTNQLDWAGNFISGVQQAYVASNASHKVWFPPIQTNSLEPNLNKFPTNQLAVRKAISMAIDRTQLSTQAEGGLEPPASNASGLVLPLFQQFLHPSVASMTLSAHSDIAGAKKVLQSAGYGMGSDGLFRTKSGQKLTIDVTNPSSFSDYAQGDAMIARWLRQAGLDARFVGQSVTAWSSDLAKGNFQLTQHWAQSSVAPYQMYNAWLNSAQATSNAAGDFERLKSPQVDSALSKLASDTSVADQQRDLGPIEQYVATNLPIIPTVYGVVFDEYNTSKFDGWPSETNPYQSGSPNTPTNEVVLLHLKPKS